MWRGPVRTGRRAFEWGLLSVLVLAMALLFMQQAKHVQGQAELAAIKSIQISLKQMAGGKTVSAKSVHEKLRGQ